MQPIQAIIAAWPFAQGQLDPLVFFRESPLRFQGVMSCDELLQLLQRGAFTAIEYVLPQASGSCVPRLWIRYSATTQDERFTVSGLDHGREETLQSFRPAHRIEVETCLERFIEAKPTLERPPGQEAPRAESMPHQVRTPTPVPAKLYVVAYVRAGERRRSGHSVRAAFAYRKAHPDPRMSEPFQPGGGLHRTGDPEPDRDRVRS